MNAVKIYTRPEPKSFDEDDKQSQEREITVAQAAKNVLMLLSR